MFDYSRPRVKPGGDRQNPDARVALLTVVATDAERALGAVEDRERLLAAGEVAVAARLVREIIGREFEV